MENVNIIKVEEVMDRYSKVRNISAIEMTLSEYFKKFNVLPVRIEKEDKFDMRDGTFRTIRGIWAELYPTANSNGMKAEREALLKVNRNKPIETKSVSITKVNSNMNIDPKTGIIIMDDTKRKIIADLKAGKSTEEISIETGWTKRTIGGIRAHINRGHY